MELSRGINVLTYREVFGTTYHGWSIVVGLSMWLLFTVLGLLFPVTVTVFMSLLGALFGYLLISSTADTSLIAYEYEVTIDKLVTVSELFDMYDFVCKDGEIYTIQKPVKEE